MGEPQKTQRVLDGGGPGEARMTATRGAEPMAANTDTESPSASDRLMEEVCERGNLQRALKRVKANKGAPGVDGMTVQALPAFLREHWPSIRASLLEGTYKPKPVRRVELPKPDGGGVRKLGIPSALDRFVQQAVLQVLQRQWDPTFSDASYGFRPGRSAHQAVERAQGYVQAGHRWVVDLNLEKFFDRVSYDILMSRVAKRVSDKRMLKLIRSFLTAGVLENGLVGATDEGTPQGGALSPLLSNLMLDDLDRELERRGLRFVRYADDCNVYVHSERAGHRVMAGLKAFLTGRLKLTVNESKSALARPHTRKFLGFTFSNRLAAKRRVAPKALARFKERIRELTQRARGISIEQLVERLKRYLTGWRGYFGFCETPSTLQRLDEWVRHRVRCVFWKQWKNSSKRFRELTARGVDRDLPAQTVGSPHAAWRLSNSPALKRALTIRYLGSLGLPSLRI